MEGEGDFVLSPEAAALTANDEGRFVESTPAAQRLLQYSEQELLTKFVWDITPGARREDARELWRRFLEIGQDTGVYQVRRADGRLVTCRYEAVARIRPGRHLSVLYPLSSALKESRPLDECPYDRPFPPDFKQCPVYEPVRTQIRDSRDSQLKSICTCANLEAQPIPGREGGFYGRCRLGDAIARSERIPQRAGSERR